MATKKQRRRQYGTGGVFRRHDHPTCPPAEPVTDPVSGKTRMVRPDHPGCKGRWVGTIEAGWTKTGARRRIPVYGKTEAEAKQKLRDKQRQIDREGLPSEDTAARLTVKTFAEAWLEETVKRLRPSSFNADRSAVNNWIVPTIGHKRFEALTPGDIRAVANAQRAAGRSTSTALRTHSTLTAMLKAAMLEGAQVPQRVLLVERPIPGPSDRMALPVADAVKVLEQASLLPHGSRWVAALLQGMRQGECLGLTWELVDIDPPDDPARARSWIPTFDVSWQLQALPYLDRRDKSKGFRVPDHFEARHLVGRMHLTRPKTEKGKRIIPLVPPMVTTLRAWRDAAPRSPYGLVWPALDGSPADYKDDDAEWYALQEAARVGHPGGRWYTIHEARHTTATLLLEARVDAEVIKAILGHSSIVTSRGYMHTDQSMTLPGLEKVAERLQLR